MSAPRLRRLIQAFIASANTMKILGPVAESLVPDNVLESQYPGFQIFRAIVENALGIKLKKVLALGLALCAILKAVTESVQLVKFFCMAHFVSTVTISDFNITLQMQVLAWTAEHLTQKSSRTLSASVDNKEDGNSRIKFNQGYGSHWFFHNRRLFRLSRTEKPVDEPKGAKMFAHPRETIEIMCLGRDPGPIKGFLDDCKKFFEASQALDLRIYRLNQHSPVRWDMPIWKSPRSMATIDMDEKIKADLIRDVKAYFHPSSKRFYANRGIPLRRGYLFHGPPGCGKSSISAALASHFGVPLYTVTLSGSRITDDNLVELFSNLSLRCVVLLEDIDSAGISRENMAAEKKGKKGGITLSGLLNAIDGASAAEGRLLVMTSNTPETLDAALIRPGRIDKQIYFGHVSKAVAAQIFKRMFTRGSDEQMDDDESAEQPENLAALANQFSEHIPENTLTPAELQCFLLDHRDAPSNAVENVKEWAEKMATSKAQGLNVVTSGSSSETLSTPDESFDEENSDDEEDEEDEEEDDNSRTSGRLESIPALSSMKRSGPMRQRIHPSAFSLLLG